MDHGLDFDWRKIDEIYQLGLNLYRCNFHTRLIEI